MAGITPSNFRLGADTLANLDDLAISAGTRTQALKEAIAQFARAVADAAVANAAELSAYEWSIIRAASIDWRGTAIRWHLRIGAAVRRFGYECLAALIEGWGPIRGYAIMANIREMRK